MKSIGVEGVALSLQYEVGFASSYMQVMVVVIVHLIPTEALFAN